jgi:putative transcription antitermination factor YqgF
MKYLGIDYGKSKFGTAFSEGELATSGEVVHITGLQDALTKIIRIIDAENIEKVVIGMPESGEASSITEKFVAALKQSKAGQKIEIIITEETLSTLHSRQFMIKMGFPKKKRSQEDAFAAAEILQSYLDEK